MNSTSHEPKRIKLTTDIEDADKALLANAENIKELRSLEMQQTEMNNRLGTIEYRSRCRAQEYHLIQEDIQDLRDTRRSRQWGIRQIDMAIRQGLARLIKLEDKMFQDMEKVRDLRERTRNLEGPIKELKSLVHEPNEWVWTAEVQEDTADRETLFP